MVNRIGGSGAGMADIHAKMKAMQERLQELGASPDASMPSFDGVSGTSDSSFGDSLKGALGAVESSVTKTNEVHMEAVNGNLDLHEVAAQLKESEITFQFALTVRNKLMDAYREVMRMSV